MNLSILVKVHLDKLDKNFIVGVSGGTDSMTLLDIVVKMGYKPIVCHVNYNLRKDSYKDQQVVKDYCLKNNLKFYVKNVDKEIKGNLQGQARKIRYLFYKEISLKERVGNVLVAHHQDDNIETYLLQKQRDILIEHYGLKFYRQVLGLNIVRPLLNASKEQIKIYASVNDLKWHEDYTNLKNIYKRNILRNELVANFSLLKRKLVLAEMKLQNYKTKKLFASALKQYENLVVKNKIDSELFNLPKVKIKIIIYKYLKENKYPVSKLDRKIIDEIISFNKKTIKPIATLDLVKNFKFKKDKNTYYIVKGEKDE